MVKMYARFAGHVAELHVIRINHVAPASQRNPIFIFLGLRWRSRSVVASRLRRSRTRLRIPRPAHILQHHRKGVPK